jgi:Zn-dependent protease
VFSEMAEFLSALRCNISLCIATHMVICLPLMCTEVDPITGLLRTVLQWMWVCRRLFHKLVLRPLGKYSDMGSLDHLLILILVLWGASIWEVSCSGYTNLHSQHRCAEGPLSLHPRQPWLSPCSFNLHFPKDC